MLALPFGEIYVPFMDHTLNFWLVVNSAFSLWWGCGRGAGRTSTTCASWAVALLTFAAVVIRMEIAGLLGLLAIQLLLDGTSPYASHQSGQHSGLVFIGMWFDLRQYLLHPYTSIL
jgi:hypothetical protein